MVLSQPDIRKAVEKGEIVFSPELEDQQWGEASVDLRLGFQFTKLREVHGVTVSIAEGLRSIGKLGVWDTKELKMQDELGNQESYDLRPREFVLALTYESIQVPRHLIARVEGRSTYARWASACIRRRPGYSRGGAGRLSWRLQTKGH